MDLKIIKIDHYGVVTILFNESLWSPANLTMYYETHTFDFKVVDYFIN